MPSFSFSLPNKKYRSRTLAKNKKGLKDDEQCRDLVVSCNKKKHSSAQQAPSSGNRSATTPSQLASLKMDVTTNKSLSSARVSPEKSLTRITPSTVTPVCQNSNKSEIFSTPENNKSKNCVEGFQFAFPSFDNAFTPGRKYTNFEDCEAQQHQSEHTCTTYSNSINDIHMSLSWGDHGLLIEEENSDPPAILDLDDNDILFDNGITNIQEAGQKSEELQPMKKTMLLFAMQNDKYEKENFVMRGSNNNYTNNPSRNEFWLSSSSSSSYFGLSSSTSQTLSKDNDDNEEEIFHFFPSWERDQTNHHPRIVSPSPSNNRDSRKNVVEKIITTAPVHPSQVQLSQDVGKGENLDAWGGIVSSPQTSVLQDLSSPNEKAPATEGGSPAVTSPFSDSFCNDEFNGSNDPFHGNKNFIQLTNSSFDGNDTIIYNEREERREPPRQEQEGEKENNLNTLSTWEDTETISLLDYSFSNECPFVVESHGGHCESSSRVDKNDAPFCDQSITSHGDEQITAIEEILMDEKGSMHDPSISSEQSKISHVAQPPSSCFPKLSESSQALHMHRTLRHHRCHRRRIHSSLEENKLADNVEDIDHQFLLANIEATIGPRGVAPDMESLSGRSSVRSVRLTRSDRTQQQQQQQQQEWKQQSYQLNQSGGVSALSRRQHPSGASIDSLSSSAASLQSHSARTTISSISRDTRSVARDLFRLEAQLADQVNLWQHHHHHHQQQQQQQQQQPVEPCDDGVLGDKNRMGSGNLHNTNTLPSSSSEEEGVSSSSSVEYDDTNYTSTLGATPFPRPSMEYEVIAPPGKLGIHLSNVRKTKDKSMNSTNTGPAYVSSIRSTSVLAGKVHVGDIFLSIDGEDVTRMNSLTITNIMARKSELSRVLRFQPLENSTEAQWREWAPNR